MYIPTTREVQIRRYELLSQEYLKEGRCITCDTKIGFAERVYRDHQTGETVSCSFWSPCSCGAHNLGEGDPYARNPETVTRTKPTVEWAPNK